MLIFFFSLLLVMPMWHSTIVILCVFYLNAIRVTILNCYKCMQLFVQIKVVFKTSICYKTPIALNLSEFLSNLCFDWKARGLKFLKNEHGILKYGWLKYFKGLFSENKKISSNGSGFGLSVILRFFLYHEWLHV